MDARALARRAIVVTADVPLAEALRRKAEAEAGAMVVVDHEGRPTGIVNEVAVEATPRGAVPGWRSARWRAASNRPWCSPPTCGEPLIDAMREAPAGEYLLVERGGEIFGVLSTADVNRLFTGV
nr:hypothetical protein GCM10020093_026690 [Planobispora longispora]